MTIGFMLKVLHTLLLFFREMMLRDKTFAQWVQSNRTAFIFFFSFITMTFLFASASLRTLTIQHELVALRTELENEKIRASARERDLEEKASWYQSLYLSKSGVSSSTPSVAKNPTIPSHPSKDPVTPNRPPQSPVADRWKKLSE